jgi:hypothetical protein
MAVRQTLFSAVEEFLARSPENLQHIFKLIMALGRIFTISWMTKERP